MNYELINKWNEESLKALYNDYYKALVAFSYTIVGSVEIAEDVVQDLLTTLWQKKVPFTSDASMKSYLYTAVHNKSVSISMKKENSMSRVSTVPHIIDDQGEELLYKEELYRQLFKAIDSLPPRQRGIFLHIIEGKTNAEIAEAMGISINTVRSQRKRGMEILRELTSAEVILLLVNILQSYTK